jgi:hypothetical protein
MLTLEAGVVTLKVQKISNKNINELKQGQKLDLLGSSARSESPST